MAVIRPSQESPTIPVPIIAGWLICMIVAVMGIKLKWFKANISINDAPVSQSETTGVYRAAFDPDSFVPSTSTSQSYSSNIKPKKPTTQKSHSGFSLFSTSAAKLNINTGNKKSNNIVTKSSSPSSKYVPKDNVTVDNKKAIITQTTVSISNEQNQPQGFTSTSSDNILKKEQIRNNLDKHKIQIHKPQSTENLSQNKINISKAKSEESIPKIGQPKQQILTKNTTTDSNKKQNVTTVSNVKNQEKNRTIEDNVVKPNVPNVKIEKTRNRKLKDKEKEKQIKKDKKGKKNKDKKDKFKNPDVTYKTGTPTKNEPTVNKTATVLRNPILLNSQNIKNPINENISRGARNPLAYGPGMSPLLQREDDQFDARNPMLTKSSNQGVSFGGRESIVGYSDTAASIFMTSNPKPILKQNVPSKKSMPSIASGNIPLGDADSIGSQTSA